MPKTAISSGARKVEGRSSKVKGSSVYELKVTLRGARPPIWRRIQVPGGVKLSTLHHIVQLVMGWGDAHLHQFTIGGESYGAQYPERDFDVADENKARLEGVVHAEKARFLYEYDFGDSWEHEILVEKILLPDPATQYPICLAGKRACPPEDCGGVMGYERMLTVLGDPSHEEYEDLKEWVGGDHDPEAFHLDHVNKALRRVGAR